MAIYKRGDTWWFKFKWNGELIRESTKQGNQRIAGQIEATRKTALAKGEVGIRDRKPTPTLGKFAEVEFSAIRRTAEKGETEDRQVLPGSGRAPGNVSEALGRFAGFDPCRGHHRVRSESSEGRGRPPQLLTGISPHYAECSNWRWSGRGFPNSCQTCGYCLARKRRERVITRDEEKIYLEVAAPLLKDFAILVFDCGLRPEELHRLKWSQIRNGNVEIHTGKTAHARRSIPASPRVMEMLGRRGGTGGHSGGDWIFPAPHGRGIHQQGQPEETAFRGAGCVRCGNIRALLPSPHVPDPMGRIRDGRFYAQETRGPCEYFDYRAVRSHERREGQDGNEKAWEVLGGHKSGHKAKSKAKPTKAVKTVTLVQSMV